MTLHSSDGAAPEALNRIYQALADRTRRAMIARLASGPTSIGELAAPFDMSLAAVGKHVKVLESVGLVTRTVEWRTHILSLDATALQQADQWMSAYRHFWVSNLDGLASYLESPDSRTAEDNDA